MARTDNLTIDEGRRIEQHESVKSEVRRKVHEDIARQAAATEVDDAKETEAAATLKEKAVREVTGTERELERGRVVARGSQVLDYAFYLVYGIITFAIVLEAIGARESAGFKQFINAIASPFVAPFRGIMNDPTVGSFQFMLSYVVALAAYLVLHAAINGLLRIFAQRKTSV
jgi:uncharacterized protein YggT (Ycf19 family)